MVSENSTQAGASAANAFTASDVAAILRERGWLEKDFAPDQTGDNSGIAGWLADAAALLGPQATDRQALGELLELIFRYDARAILEQRESHAILARQGARAAIRELGHRVLEGPAIDSDRFKAMVDALKATLGSRGRELFHPLRLALAGRAGEGELDRVILLLDRAAQLPFRVPVKNTRARMLEFCAALE